MKRARVRPIPYTYKGKTEQRWIVQWYDLKHVRREKRFEMKREADQYAIQIDREIADMSHVSDRGTMTFAQVAEKYLSWIEGRPDITGGTKYAYRYEVRKYLIPHFGHMKLRDIDTVTVQRFIDEQAQEFKRGFIVKFYARMLGILDYAVSREGFPRNVLRDKPVKIPGKQAKRSEIPEFAEVRQLFTYLMGPRPHAVNRHCWANFLVMVALGAFAGPRTCEVAGLKWGHIDWAKNEINFQASRTIWDGDKAPKTEAGNRSVPMSPILRRILEEHFRFWGNPPADTHVLRNRSGSPWSTLLIQQSWRLTVMPGAGLTKPGREAKGPRSCEDLPKFDFYALRHFAVSAWLAAGMRIQDVGRHIGHANIATTMGVYAHLLKGDTHSREVITNLAKMFPGLPTAPVPTQTAPVPLRIESLAITVDTTAPVVPVAPMVPALEATAAGVIRAPDNAPAWVEEILKRLQEGWHLQDACDHVRRKRSSVYETFKRHGLPNPSDIVRQVRESREEMVSAGYADADIAAKCGCSYQTVWEWRVQREGRGQKVYRNPKCPNRVVVTGNSREN